MKKSILSAVAVAALTVGGVAQADIIDGVGNTISRIFGVPYSPYPSGSPPVVSVYRDAWGRNVHVGPNNQPLYIEQNGQLIPYGNYAAAPSYDDDADGVSNQYDRYPRDARYR